jgi:hypothetical protein
MTDPSETRAQTRALAEKAAAIRQDVEALVREMERQGLARGGLRVRLQDRPVAVIIAATATLSLAGFAAWVLLRERRRERQLWRVLVGSTPP